MVYDERDAGRFVEERPFLPHACLDGWTEEG